jgi:hypothetical protein
MKGAICFTIAEGRRQLADHMKFTNAKLATIATACNALPHHFGRSRPGSPSDIVVLSKVVTTSYLASPIINRRRSIRININRFADLCCPWPDSLLSLAGLGRRLAGCRHQGYLASSSTFSCNNDHALNL